jgi:hypothetical protein
MEAIPCRKIRFFERIFCFLWTPFIRVKLKFSKMKTKTSIDKLKSSIKKIIQMDDDIYCQFREKEDIFKIIDDAQSIKELIVRVQQVLGASSLEPESESLGTSR